MGWVQLMNRVLGVDCIKSRAGESRLLGCIFIFIIRTGEFFCFWFYCWSVACRFLSATRVGKRSERELTSTRNAETALIVGSVSSWCDLCVDSNISSHVTRSSRTSTLMGIYAQSQSIPLTIGSLLSLQACITMARVASLSYPWVGWSLHVRCGKLSGFTSSVL